MKANFDQACACRADGVVVAVALLPGHNEFVRETVAMRQSLHASKIEPSQDGGRPQHETGRGAASD